MSKVCMYRLFGRVSTCQKIQNVVNPLVMVRAKRFDSRIRFRNPGLNFKLEAVRSDACKNNYFSWSKR